MPDRLGRCSPKNNSRSQQLLLGQYSNLPPEDDPRTYGEYATESIYLLLTQSTLPKATNLKNALARMAHVPRVIATAKATIKEAVVRSIRERSLGDVKSDEVVNIPFKKIAEPRLHHASQGGDRDHVLPGNKEFVKGDTLPKPKSGEGGGGSEGSPDGEGEDDFRFTISADEYLSVLFEELELPDLAKAKFKDVETLRYHRAGHSSSGSPSMICRCMSSFSRSRQRRQTD